MNRAGLVLVSWVAFASDPYQRDRKGHYQQDGEGKLIPGVALEILTDRRSPFHGQVARAYFLVRNGPVADGSAREVHPRELDVYAALEQALTEQLRGLDVRPLVWDTTEQPTAHRPLLKFTAESLRRIRRENPTATLLVNVGTGTAQMHTTMLVALGAGCAGENVTAIQSILRDRRRDPTKILEEVPWDLLERLNIEESRPEVEAGRPTWDLESARSPGLRQMLAQIDEAARVPFPVLIHGSRGSGKTRVAERLRARYLAHRKRVGQGSWELRVNCAALQKELLLSELFGHEKGAFTGAHRKKKGLLELAEGDCIFLDEVHHLDGDAQAKLLVALERRGEFRPLGSDTPKRSDFRLLCATNRPLAELRKVLLPDFWDRIADFKVHVPDLRACRDDLDGMWRCALQDACEDVAAVRGKSAPAGKEIAAGLFGRFREEHHRTIVSKLEEHELPGNWRDLQRMARRLVARSLGTGERMKVDLGTIERLLAEFEPTGDVLHREEGSGDEQASTPRDATLQSIERLAAWLRGGHAGDRVVDLDGLHAALEELLLEAAFEARGGGQASAELVGLPKRTFNDRRRKLRATVKNSLRRGKTSA